LKLCFRHHFVVLLYYKKIHFAATDFDITLRASSQNILIIILKIFYMQNYDSPTFIEMLKTQIREEQRKYRNALISGKEFVELRLIKRNIEKLEASLQHLLKTLHEYIPQATTTI
jgi:hypothetical protein